MKAGARRRLLDWARMVAPALLFVALKALFRAAAPVVARHTGADATLAQMAADALSLSAAALTALAAFPGESLGSGAPHGRGARRLARCAVVGLAAGLAALLLGRLFGIGDDRQGGFLSFVLLCLLGPVAEELVYRGLVFERGMRFLSPAGTIAVSALLFGVSHGSPGRMALAAAAGALLGCARLREGTVLAPILIHGVMNGVQFLLRDAIAR